MHIFYICVDHLRRNCYLRISPQSFVGASNVIISICVLDVFYSWRHPALRNAAVDCGNQMQGLF